MSGVRSQRTLLLCRSLDDPKRIVRQKRMERWRRERSKVVHCAKKADTKQCALYIAHPTFPCLPNQNRLVLFINFLVTCGWSIVQNHAIHKELICKGHMAPIFQTMPSSWPNGRPYHGHCLQPNALANGETPIGPHINEVDALPCFSFGWFHDLELKGVAAQDA
jgi:hypothetical protein